MSLVTGRPHPGNIIDQRCLQPGAYSRDHMTPPRLFRCVGGMTNEDGTIVFAFENAKTEQVVLQPVNSAFVRRLEFVTQGADQ